ncbi:aldo/keto reductase [Paenibacillus sp. FSL R5-0713]|uniref:aldo/keto reductase n=1 Tax=Paenibacillus sp. FSL R5-0713 TaxID=2921655 RepID=UPI0030DC3423
MEKRTLGKTDMHVGVMGFGSSQIGYEQTSQETVNHLLNLALDHGLNAIDTAECYPNSEERIGQAVSGRRAEFYLFTKCGHSDEDKYHDWDPDWLELSVDRSLKRLGTDYIDVLQLHGCSEEILQRGEVIQTLKKIQAAGKARYLGYSGDGEQAKYAIKMQCFDTLQVTVNIADQIALDEIIPLAQQQQLGVIVKRPIANAAWVNSGEHKKRYERQLAMWKRMGKTPESMVKPAKVTYEERLLKLGYSFQEDPLLTTELALRFALSIPGVHTVMIGTTKPDRWRDNYALASKGNLAEEQYKAIRERWKERMDKEWFAVP